MIEWLRPLFDTWGYLILGLGAALENSLGLGLLVPGETLVLLGGFYSAVGRLSPVLVALVATGAAVVGDSVGHQLGSRRGARFLERHGGKLFLSPRRIARAKRYYELHGRKTLVLGRFVPILRMLIPFLAGVSKMPYRRFVAYDAVGSLIWASFHTTIGYLVGSGYSRLRGSLGTAGLIALGLLLVSVLATGWWARRKVAFKDD